MTKWKYEPRPQCRTCPHVEVWNEEEWFCKKDDYEQIFFGRYQRRPSWCPIAKEREEKRLNEISERRDA